MGNLNIATVHEAIARMAELQPDKSFLFSPETKRETTYIQLKQHAQQLTQMLQNRGLSKGDKVAFLLDNGLFAAELFLGAMYGGFVPVPLNVRAGRSHLAFTLDHCDARIVFVSDDYLSLMEDVGSEVRRDIVVIRADVDCGPGWDNLPSSDKALADIRAEDDALLVYTSGSTGMPKGALFSQRKVIAGAWNSINPHALTSEDRSLCVLPLYHMNAENVTLLPTLLTGGSVVLPHRFLVRHFWEWLTGYRCTWSALVPTIITQLLDWIDPRAEGMGEELKRIRFLRSSSAPLAPSLHRAFEEKFQLLLLEAMGSTECCGNIFSNPLPPGKDKIGTPGLPFGFEVKVVQSDGAPVLAGQAGQIVLRGPSVMDGYYKNPEETAKVLDSAGWLKTGDLACLDEDGYYFIVGRAKELIIKGGMNIAPRQIDDVLEAHPAVLEAAALGVPDHYLGEDIIAFTVLRPTAQVLEEELRDFCERHLGPFKTPSRIFLVKELPKGPTGKIQRLRLPELFEDVIRTSRKLALANGSGEGPVASGRAAALAAPLTSVQEIIAEMWAKVLDTDVVGIHDNFFGLGGHSLLAIETLTQVRKQFTVDLSLNEFFQHPTVAGQAELVSEQLCQHGQGGATPSTEGRTTLEEILLTNRPIVAGERTIPRRNPTLPCPLSPAQERLWFLEQLHPGLSAYNEGDAARLQGPLDVRRLEEAMNVIVARHEELRTLIRVVDDTPVQLIHESWPIHFEVIDLSALPEAERESNVKRLLIEEHAKPFDLTVAPAIRGTVVRLQHEEHVVIFALHHLVCDGWSMGILFRELATVYQALARRQPYDLGPLPLHYGDFAAWKRQQVDEGAFAKELAFWKEYLRGAPAALELPIDNPRPQVFSYRGQKCSYPLGRENAAALRRFSQQEQISLFMVLTAAFNALLFRYTRQEDIVLGVPFADRDRPEFLSLFGFLIDFHALRTDLSGNPTFRELLGRVRKGLLDVNANRALPFQKVMQALNPPRDLSRAQIFQVMLIWKDRHVQMQFMDIEELAVSYEMAHAGASKFDLTLWLTDVGDDIWLEFEYCTSLFTANTIGRMAEHFRVLLGSIVANPDERVACLSLLTAAERRQLFVEWNDTRADFPRNRCLHELFEAQAEQTPDKVAVVYEDRQWTYRELNNRADQLAQHLQTLGVAPDVLVALSVERSLEMVVGLLGILKAGGAYLPLDPMFPRDRLAFMLEDAKPRVLVTQANLQAALPNHAIPVVLLDSMESPETYHWSKGQASRPLPTRRPQSSNTLAYVLYTSGSTGQPKGVQIEQAAVVNLLTAMRCQPGLQAEDVLLSVTTLSFDIAALELFLPLTTGARLVLAGSAIAADGMRLASLLESSGATVMQATPATWRMLVQAGWKGNSRLTILCGGEALAADLADQLLARGAALWNLYGPTETTIWSTVAQVRHGQAVVIGRPIANTQIYLFDEHLQPVPAGTPGELYIGGQGLARGYLNRPELNATRFIANPHSTDPEARLYRTSDLARYRANGDIEYLGRLDEQVKIHGYRIEPGEIEAVLGAHPQVRDRVVVAREDQPGEKRLVAYVVPAGEPPPPVSKLRAWLEKKLPPYMIPSIFVFQKELPLTPNGKMDRRALPIPGRDMETHGSYTAPRTPVEQDLAAIWSQVLGLDRVGVHNNFFDLGGHSLLAVRLFAQIEHKFGRRLPLATLLQGATIAQLAVVVQTEVKLGSRTSIIPIQPKGAKPPLIFLPSFVGEVLYCSNIARHLRADQPVFGIQLSCDDGQLHPPSSLEAIAARCVEELRAFQSNGPYLLAGYSFAGRLAFEMARQLSSEGYKVSLLAIIDTSPHRLTTGSVGQRLWNIGSRFMNFPRWFLDDVLRGNPKKLAARIGRGLRALGTRLKRLLQYGTPAADGTELRELFDTRKMPEGYRKLIEANMRAFGKYVPKPYPGRVTLFRARTRHLLHSDQFDLAWGRWAAGGVEINTVPGNHESMLEEPHIRTLAQQLQAALDRGKEAVAIADRCR